MREYDFRFPGLREPRSGDAENLDRLLQVRKTILKIAGGFTEINPREYTDLIPGDGMGYIVGLSSKKKARALETALHRLAASWEVTPPKVTPASKGPRANYAFVLIPEKANEVLPATGERRNLFTPERWARILAVIRPKLSHPVRFVHGEWAPEGVDRVILDDLRMYIVRFNNPAVEKFLKDFLQSEVFDGGKECDQRAIYLSLSGTCTLIRERRKR